MLVECVCVLLCVLVVCSCVLAVLCVCSPHAGSAGLLPTDIEVLVKDNFVSHYSPQTISLSNKHPSLSLNQATLSCSHVTSLYMIIAVISVLGLPAA